MQKNNQNISENKLVENPELFSKKLVGLKMLLGIKKDEIVRLYNEMKEERDLFVERNLPSWYHKPCFVKVHYREKEKIRIEREGYMIPSDAEWIEKVSPVLYLYGFYLDKNEEHLFPKLYYTVMNDERLQYEPDGGHDCYMFDDIDDKEIMHFEIVNKKYKNGTE